MNELPLPYHSVTEGRLYATIMIVVGQGQGKVQFPVVLGRSG